MTNASSEQINHIYKYKLDNLCANQKKNVLSASADSLICRKVLCYFSHFFLHVLLAMVLISIYFSSNIGSSKNAVFTTDDFLSYFSLILAIVMISIYFSSNIDSSKSPFSIPVTHFHN